MNYIYYILALIIIIRMMIIILKRSKIALHLLQLEKYNTENYKKSLNKNKELIFSSILIDVASNKSLVFTKRAKRLYRTNLIISTIVLLGFAIPYIITLKLLYMIFLLLASFIVYRQQPYFILISNIIMEPIEKNINNNFYVQAQEKIKGLEDLKVIGIAGSFGKTSTKFIVGTILEDKYKVLSSPESYNTRMGLSKVINDDIDASIEVFVAEMGSRKMGEIEELAKLCQPRIGIITSIGPAHIETFKNTDNIMKTKYELIEALPAEGVAIFNYDNKYIKKLADKTFKEKLLYGLEDIEKLDIYADDVIVSELGSTFTIRDKEGNSQKCRTKLIGKHNISNILAGVCASRALGLSFEEICDSITKIEPIPHSLNIINPDSGIIIIDDAFNSNPIGTKAALEVLSQFKEGKKIIVTPGMVELGEIEEAANKEFGTNIGKVCDYAVLIGKARTQPIYNGLMESNFNPQNIFIVDTLDEASVQIDNLVKPKDVILFENDLPESYIEKII